MAYSRTRGVLFILGDFEEDAVGVVEVAEHLVAGVVRDDGFGDDDGSPRSFTPASRSFFAEAWMSATLKAMCLMPTVLANELAGMDSPSGVL